MVGLRLAAAAGVAALAASVSGAPGSGAATTLRCGVRSVHAVVAGKERCLSDATPCRARLNATYRRYVFTCVDGRLAFWWAGLLRRPVHIPSLPAGSPCPASEARGTIGFHGSPAFGPGPAYAGLGAIANHAALIYLVGWGYDGWDGTKLLWIVPGYYGPYIVRGRQLDGPSELRFDQGPGWTNRLHSELRFVGPEGEFHPAATYLHGPGCYAYQVDGRGFSYLIVFAARPAS
jgi:hypothetical protein